MKNTFVFVLVKAKQHRNERPSVVDGLQVRYAFTFYKLASEENYV